MIVEHKKTRYQPYELRYLHTADDGSTASHIRP